MTLHQIKIFDAVAKHLNVTKASREVRISQPTVSKQLKHLQDEFRVKFYLRLGQGIELTDEGRRFWEAVQPILKGMDELTKTFSMGAKETNLFAVGGTESFSSSLIPEALQVFKLIHPDVQPILRTGLSPALESMVLNSEIELAFVLKPSYNPRVAVEYFCSEPVVAVISSKHPLARRKRLNQEVLGNAPFIVRTGGTITKQLTEMGIERNPVLMCSSAEAVRSAVQSAVGIGFFFRDSVERGLTDGYLKILEIPKLKEFHVNVYMISRKSTPLSRYAEDFLAVLRQTKKLKYTHES